MCAGLLLYAVQFSTIAVAIPVIIEDLDASLTSIGWVVTAYIVAQAAIMPLAGRMSDELGRRPVFLAAVLMFAASSGLCGIATSPEMLIGGRVLQGLAAGTLMPTSFAIIGDWFTANRAQAIGLVSSIPPAGAIFGPFAGALVVDLLDWRWTFLMNVPLALLLVAPATWKVPKTRTIDHLPLDILGAGLLALAITSSLLALSEIGEGHGTSATLVVFCALAVIAAVGFVRREATVANPVVPLDLLAHRQFITINTINFFWGASNFGIVTFVPLFAQLAYGLSLAESGALLMIRALGVVAASTVVSFLLPRLGYRGPIVSGLAVLSLALALIAVGTEIELLDGVPRAIALGSFLLAVGVGHGIAGPAANNAALDLAPDRVGSAMGLRGMFRFVGGAFGTAAVVAISTQDGSQGSGIRSGFLILAAASLLAGMMGLLVRNRVPPQASAPEVYDH